MGVTFSDTTEFVIGFTKVSLKAALTLRPMLILPPTSRLRLPLVLILGRVVVLKGVGECVAVLLPLSLLNCLMMGGDEFARICVIELRALLVGVTTLIE